MKFYLAPLEGITGFIYRNTYAEVFNDIDKYFAPFVVPNESRSLRTKEFFDILPENNKHNLIPQILTNNPEGFILTMQKMKRLGYDEINLNLGCPSSTVVNKNRGSGFLAFPDELDVFLEKTYDSAVKENMKVSIKTRLGRDNADEFYKILDIYNKYPLEELIIHPRTQKDFYGKTIHTHMFKYAMENSKNPLCYNGNIFTEADYKNVKEQLNFNFAEDSKEHNKESNKKECIEEYSEKECNEESNKEEYNRQFNKESDNSHIDRIMLGRGIIANPGLLYEIKNNETVSKDKIKEFHDKLLENHLEVYSNERGILFKLKEIWAYMIHIFTNSREYNIELKKSQNISEYKEIVERLFREEEIIPGGGLFENKI